MSHGILEEASPAAAAAAQQNPITTGQSQQTSYAGGPSIEADELEPLEPGL